MRAKLHENALSLWSVASGRAHDLIAKVGKPRMPTATGWRLAAAAALALSGAFYAWQLLGGSDLPESIGTGNGRIEAVEIDVATKIAGRIKTILVREGDFVTAGQVLARMDTQQLEAQLRQAQAQVRRAIISVDTAESQVKQREAERTAAVAVAEQRQAELDATESKLGRTEKLAQKDIVSQQVLDDTRAAQRGAKAALAAAQAQIAASEAAISSAKAQVVDAEAAVDAARATIEGVDADISDSVLRSPRDGRVQYRVAEPGEVLSAGGRVLNLVDVGDVYMTFFLPTEQAGRVAIGSEVRLVLDVAPQYVVPARATFVADVAQFTPKTVETEIERQKLMFRIKAHILPELLRKHIQQVKTGLPGRAYVRLDPNVEWPAKLRERLVE